MIFFRRLQYFTLLFLLVWYLSLPGLSYAIDLLNKPITLREKIGQMLMFGFNDLNVNANSEVVKWIEKYNLGGVIAYDIDEDSRKIGKNIKSKAQIFNLTKQLQAVTRQANIKYKRNNYPLLIAIDYEGGRVDRLKTADGFEPTLSPALMPKVSESKLKHEIAKMTNNLKSAGFNLDFAPILDVAVNSKNPIITIHERSYSSNPQEVTQYAELFMNALRTHHIQCAFKHFPGHGSSDNDSHNGFVDVTKTWRSYEIFPYHFLIIKSPSCGVVMTGHLVNKTLDSNGLPATLSYKILTNLLRQHLHFNGVIISDDMQMKAIAANYSLQDAVTLAINAGVDMLLFANQASDKHMNPKDIIDLIEQQVKIGKIKESRIEDAYNRIQTLKAHI